MDVSLTDLTDLMIENWLLSILHIQPLTKTCYHNMVGIIKGELEYAARRRLITRSPYETVNLDLHNLLRVPEDKPDEKQVFAPEEVLEFESLALEDFNEAGRKVYRLAPLAALFAFYCGTRVGELTGLMHTDVTDKEIHIRRFVRREDHQVIERAKTKSGIRTIPLTAKGREILSLVDQYKQENGIPRNGFVFSEYDRPLPSRIVEEYFMKYCTKIRTPHKSTHTVLERLTSPLWWMPMSTSIQSGKLRGMQMSVRHIGTMYSTAVHLLKKCRNSRLHWTTKTACNPMQPPQQQMSNVKNFREGTQ